MLETESLCWTGVLCWKRSPVLEPESYALCCVNVGWKRRPSPLRVFTDIVSDIVADISQAVGVYRGPGAGQEHRDGRGVITNDYFSLDTH